MSSGGKVLAPGGSSADLHSDQIRAGQVSSYSTAASNEPPAMPRTSEGAVSIEAKLQKPSDGQSAPGHRTGRSHGDQGVVAAVPQVTLTTHPETSGKGESTRPMRIVILAPMHFITRPANRLQVPACKVIHIHCLCAFPHQKILLQVRSSRNAHRMREALSSARAASPRWTAETYPNLTTAAILPNPPSLLHVSRLLPTKK